MPTSDELAKILKAFGVNRCVLAGELYAVDSDGSKLSLGPVMHRIKKPSNREEEESVRFRVFDIIEFDGITTVEQEMDYKAKCFLIDELFKDAKYADLSSSEQASKAQKKCGLKSKKTNWKD